MSSVRANRDAAGRGGKIIYNTTTRGIYNDTRTLDRYRDRNRNYNDCILHSRGFEMTYLCKFCKKELQLLKSPGVNPCTMEEYKCVCGDCWVKYNGKVGEVI